MKFDAVIFDMDGLLIDIMIHWIEHDREWFAEFGEEVTPEFIKFFTGKSLKQNIEWMKNEYNLEGTIEELMARRIGITNEIYTKQSKPLPGEVPLLSTVQNIHITQAIASGSSQQRIRTIVDRFDRGAYFDMLLSTDDVGFNGKPESDVYLFTADQLGVDTSRCLVFEDAENGVVSAKAAGMQCIAVALDRDVDRPRNLAKSVTVE